MKKIFTFVILLHSFWIFSAPTLKITENKTEKLYSFLSYYEDTSQNETIDSVIEKCQTHKFSNNIPENLAPRKVYWIHFKVYNLISVPGWALHLQAKVSNLDIYKVSGQYKEKTSWESVNNYHKISGMLTIEPGDTIEFYIRLHQKMPINFELKHVNLVPQRQVIMDFIEQSSLSALIAGIMCFMLINSFFQYINQKRKVYLLYMLYIVFHLIFLIHGSYFMEFVVVPQQQFSYVWLFLTLTIGHLFYIWFIREFLNPQNIPPKLDKGLFLPYIAFIVVTILLLISLLLYDYFLFLKVYYIIPLFYAVIGLVLAILLMIKIKQVESKLVLIGTCISIITGFLSLFFDNLPYMENNHIYNIGMVVDMMFFTFALNYQQRKEQENIHSKEIQVTLLSSNIQYKQRELTQKAIQIAQQEELFGNIRKNLEVIDPENLKSKEIIDNIIGNIDFYSNNSSWADFESIYNEVHPEFQTKLKTLYPELSQNDLRICALLRLCLNTKEIANITQKTPKSIEISRSRIRQKMNLGRDENLFDVLSRVD